MRYSSKLKRSSQLALMHNADHYMGNAARFNEGLQEQE